MRPEEVVLLPFVFALGAIVGSFANVCIHRLPRGESVVTPRSRCPRCGHAVAAWDNVPILSWLLLRARCRDCGAPISVRYVLVETLVGAIFFAAAWALRQSSAALKAWAWVMAFSVRWRQSRISSPKKR